MTAAGVATEPITVFLLEDHDLVRRSVAQLLELEPDMHVVSESATAAGALEAIAETKPTVAMLDVRLQDGNGIEVCRDIRTLHPDVHCIMLTSFSDDRAVLDAALAGASGFVLKQIRSNDIVRSVREVARGAVLLDDETIRACLERLQATEDEGVARLTNGERRLFHLIGSGRTNREIAQVLGTDVDTVRNDVSLLLRSLGMVRRTEVSDAFRRTGVETFGTAAQDLSP